MKVLQINAVGKTGSTGRTTWELHDYLQKKGIESSIVTATAADCPESFSMTNRVGIFADKLMSLISGLEGYSSILPTMRLLQYLRIQQPDVVHLRNLHESYINLGMLLSYLARHNIATVVSLHDFWFFTGKCCSPNRFDCEKWISGCKKCPALRFDYRKRLFDFTSKMWNDKRRWFSKIPRLAVIGNSKWTTENAMRSTLRCASICDTIYNWIDQSVFYPKNVDVLRAQYGLEHKKVILAVSSFWSLSGGKGYSTYLQLADVIPNDWIIVLIGKHLSNNCDNNRIKMIPSTNDCEVLASWYSVADVYLNLSESETFGKAAAEAICCGTPVVALNRTANPEIVPAGAGYILDTTDTGEIINALHTIFSNPKEDYQNVCTAYAQKHFDKNKNMEAFIMLYRRLLEM